MTRLSLEGLTFDIGSTMVAPPPHGAIHAARAASWCRLLEGAGRPVTAEEVTDALEAAMGALKATWTAGDQFTGSHATDFCLDHLGVSVDGPLRAALIEALEEASVEGATVTPNLVETLTRLTEAGLRLGVISDTFITPGSGWRRHLHDHGVAGFFGHWTFSDQVGAYKPSAAVFADAAAGLGVDDPGRLAHIGDLRRTDVAGARAAGWWSVRYAGVDNDESDLPDADFVIKDHRELLSLLEL